jgi:hypothetical protein
MYARRFFAAMFAAGLCLAAPPQAPATDGESGERFAPAPSEAGVAGRELRDEESILSQLRHEGRIGGPEVGYELRAVKTHSEVLVAPTLTQFDRGGRRVVYWTADTLELRAFPKTDELFLRMRNGLGTTEDGSVCYFDDRIIRLEFPHARPK